MFGGSNGACWGPGGALVPVIFPLSSEDAEGSLNIFFSLLLNGFNVFIVFLVDEHCPSGAGGSFLGQVQLKTC